MALWQTIGFVENLLRLAGFDWTVPDFRTLSLRQKTLAFNTPYTARANDLERHDALYIHCQNISGMLRLLESGRTDGRRAALSDAASTLISLDYSAMRRDPERLISIETLVRPAILPATCNTILSCVTVAEPLELDLPAALARCSRHCAIPNPLKYSSFYRTARDSVLFRRQQRDGPEGIRMLNNSGATKPAHVRLDGRCVPRCGWP
jgi:hypothetical protein